MSILVPNENDYEYIEDDYLKMEDRQQPKERNALAVGGSHPSPSGVKRAVLFIGVIVVIGVVLLCVACIICSAFAFIEITKLKAQLNDQGT